MVEVTSDEVACVSMNSEMGRFIRIVLGCVSLLLSKSLGAATASDFTFEQSPPFEAQGLGYMPYRMYQAQGYDLPANSAKSYPLIVWLHGLGERGTNNTSQLVHGVVQMANDVNQAYEPSFVIAPQADSSSGSWGSRFVAGAFVTETRLMLAIEDLKTRFRIDPDRIYVMGLSYGGAGTWNIVTHYPGFFAAAVPMSQPAAASSEHLGLLTHFPVWSYDGSNDSITAGTVSALRNVGGRPIYTVVSGGGHNDVTWVTAAEDPDLYRWMMAQRRNTASDTSSLPYLRIDSPGIGGRGYQSDGSPVDLSGIAALTASTHSGFSSIDWYLDNGNLGSATGTTGWSGGQVNPSGGRQLLQVTASASNDSAVTRAGTCTFSDSVVVNDGSPPELFLSNPVSGSGYIAPSAKLTLRGYATDDFAVAQIKWTNGKGEFGLAGGEYHHGIGGRVNWFMPDIPLEQGHNVLTLEAFDLAGNRDAHVLNVYRLFCPEF